MAETDATTPDATIGGSDAECRRCGKPTALCVCAGIEPIDNRVGLLILQHPQEQDRELGTARLTVLHLKRATMKVGLSWPSLTKALGREVDPKRWAVLYLGAASAATLPKDREITLIDGKGAPLPEQDRALAEIDGVIVLDGSWSQAKTMWWRNAWVLKCRRLALNPKQPSRYGKLRREPRREGLSTSEAAALALSRLGRQPEIETALGLSFARLLNAYRSANTRAK
jgi:DTW domain-containing protein